MTRERLRAPGLRGLLVFSVLALPCVGQIRFEARDGEYLPTFAASLPREVDAIAAADMDGDGHVDLFMSGRGGGIFFNDGRGRFLATAQAGLAGRVVATADLDGDGDLDYVTGGGHYGYALPQPMTVGLNQGNRTFAPAPVGPPAVSVLATALGLFDIDSDGDVDAVVLNEDFAQSVLNVWANDGAGGFTDVTATAVATQPSRGGGAVFADVDGDGATDVVLSRFPENVWLRNDGNGHLVSTPTTGLGSGAVIARDLDGDGDVDLVNRSAVALNDGTGSFTSAGSIPTRAAWSRVAADFDGDGAIDLAGTTSFQHVPELLRNDGAFGFADESATWFESHVFFSPLLGGYEWSCSVAFDTDGDGDTDLVTAGGEGRSAASTTVGIPPRVFENVGGQLVDVTRPAFPYVQTTSGHLTAADVDDDGLVELATGGALHRQDRSGRFEFGGFSNWYDRSEFIDVDADGDVDWLVPSSGALTRLLLNDGTGTFTDVTAQRVPTTPAISVAGGDVDGDGDVDIALGDMSPQLSGAGAPLGLWLNDGTGTFTDASANVPFMVEGGELELVDVDADGDVDLIASGVFPWGAAGPVRLFTNDGTGVFAEASATQFPTGFGSRTFLVRDLDGDGDVDVGIRGGDFVNDGSGTFVFTALPSGQLATADFDEDGVRDFVEPGGCHFRVGSQVFCLGNNSSDAFVWTVDLDDDGDEDLVATLGFMNGWQWTTGKIGVYYNLRRDLRFAAFPRIGRRCELALRATGNGTAPTNAFVLVAGARVAPIDFGSFGRLHLDPVQMVFLGSAVIPDADTEAVVGLDVPADPSFAGVELSAQALFVPVGQEGKARLGPAVTEVVR